jgi:hypothetical protein
MPPIDSRLGPGTLKLGSPLVEFGTQIANVTLEPSQDEEDGTPTLAEPDPAAEISEAWALTGEAIQDFEEPTGFVNYCFDNALTIVDFEFTPNTAAGVKYTGECRLVSVPIGGDAGTQITSTFEFPVVGTPVRVDPGAAPSAAARRARKARRERAKRATESSSSSSSSS